MTARAVQAAALGIAATVSHRASADLADAAATPVAVRTVATVDEPRPKAPTAVQAPARVRVVDIPVVVEHLAPSVAPQCRVAVAVRAKQAPRVVPAVMAVKVVVSVASC